VIKLNNTNDLPRLLDPETIKKKFFCGDHMPNLSINAVYELFHRKDFPSIKIGRKWYVPTHLFLQWLDHQAMNKENSN
jgi:hypothetical protein